MTKFKNIQDVFSKPIPKHIQETVDLNLEISEQVHRILERKGWNQTDLAKAMGKTNAEVSKWLSGLHNLTTASIGKMTAALGEPIIHSTDCAKKEFATVQYVTMKVHVSEAHVSDSYPDKQMSISYKQVKYGK